MAKIIVTGGAGFIGSHVIDKLIDNGHTVASVDNYSSVNSGYRNSRAIYIEKNILDDTLSDTFESFRPDFCIHLAAQASVAVATKNPIYDAEQNIIGSIKVLELCKKYNVKKIIAASSAAVYGNPQYLPVDENHPTDVLSAYGLSKLTMEKYIQLSGLNYVIYRFANVYGERQTASGEAGVIAIFNDAMKNNHDIHINGDGEQTRDFVYVKDVANACLQAIEKDIKNEITNVSTNKSISINTLFKEMAKIYNYKKSPIYYPIREGDIKHSILNNQKLRSLVDLNTFTEIHQGLSALCNNQVGEFVNG